MNQGKLHLWSRPGWAASLLLALHFAVFPLALRAQTEAEFDLSVPQARIAARQALAQGNPQVADAISTALLNRDPNDAEALLIRAVLARGTGQLDAARESAAKAYSVSENPALKFDAAMLVADIHSRQENLTRAQLWLRRADQVAPDDQRREVAARSYGQVARRNPLRVQLRFTARPSNNVNNGAANDVIEIGGLPFTLDPSGQQLGGYEASTGVSLAYRLSENEKQKTEVLGEIYYRRVWLDSDAKADAPGVEGSDFNYGIILTGIQHQRILWPELGASRATALIGQSWYGGEKLARWGEIQFSQTVRQTQESALDFGLSVRKENRLDAGINDSVSLALSTDYRVAAAGGGQYSFGATLRNVWSDSATVDLFSFGLEAARSFGRIGPVQPRVSTTLENRNYHKWASTPGGREDLSMSLGLDVTWPDVSYYGFAPQMSVLARRTWSDVDIYDRNEISLGLTAVSRF